MVFRFCFRKKEGVRSSSSVKGSPLGPNTTGIYRGYFLALLLFLASSIFFALIWSALRFINEYTTVDTPINATAPTVLHRAIFFPLVYPDSDVVFSKDELMSFGSYLKESIFLMFNN